MQFRVVIILQYIFKKTGTEQQPDAHQHVLTAVLRCWHGDERSGDQERDAACSLHSDVIEEVTLHRWAIGCRRFDGTCLHLYLQGSNGARRMSKMVM